MAKFSSGKYAYGISDRSGQRYRLKDMRLEWNGFLVGKDEWESKQPQLTPARVVSDPQALKNSRPDRTETAVEVLLDPNSFLSGSSGSATLTVREVGHGRSTGDTVRFRDVIGFDGFTAAVLTLAAGYSITRVDDDNYTFSASSGTATTGSKFGGGYPTTAGPVALEP
jgi:hypothetical protein